MEKHPKKPKIINLFKEMRLRGKLPDHQPRYVDPIDEQTHITGFRVNNGYTSSDAATYSVWGDGERPFPTYAVNPEVSLPERQCAIRRIGQVRRERPGRAVVMVKKDE